MININKLPIILAIVCLLLSICSAQDKVLDLNWKKFTSVEGKFEATFPSIPVESVKEVSATNGKGKIYSFGVSIIEPEIYFVVFYADFPTSQAMDQDALRTNYDTVQAGMLKTQNADLLSQKDVWANENLGREITFKAGNGFIKYQMYLIGSRQYQVMVSTKSSLSKDEEIEKSINKFLDSFKIIEKQNN